MNADTLVGWVLVLSSLVVLTVWTVARVLDWAKADVQRRVDEALAGPYPATVAHIAHHEAARIDDEWAAFNERNAS